jgi:hypothetical protein
LFVVVVLLDVKEIHHRVHALCALRVATSRPHALYHGVNAAVAHAFNAVSTLGITAVLRTAVDWHALFRVREVRHEIFNALACVVGVNPFFFIIRVIVKIHHLVPETATC